jgi:hypothetical protein
MAHQRLTETSKLLAILMRELGDSSTPEDNQGEGWTRTKDLLPLLGVVTMGSGREIADRLVASGFAERKRIKFDRVLFRLSPKFATWKEAKDALRSSRMDKVPAGWASLSAIALDLGMTVRALQYQATQGRFPYKVYKTPASTRHYERSRFRG